ncbi:hypothetical protein RFI_21776, partial [Reticulomyxa filosa]
MWKFKSRIRHNLIRSSSPTLVITLIQDKGLKSATSVLKFIVKKCYCTYILAISEQYMFILLDEKSEQQSKKAKRHHKCKSIDEIMLTKLKNENNNKSSILNWTRLIPTVMVTLHKPEDIEYAITQAIIFDKIEKDMQVLWIEESNNRNVDTRMYKSNHPSDYVQRKIIQKTREKPGIKLTDREYILQRNNYILNLSKSKRNMTTRPISIHILKQLKKNKNKTKNNTKWQNINHNNRKNNEISSLKREIEEMKAANHFLGIRQDDEGVVNFFLDFFKMGCSQVLEYFLASSSTCTSFCTIYMHKIQVFL